MLRSIRAKASRKPQTQRSPDQPFRLVDIFFSLAHDTDTQLAGSTAKQQQQG